MQEAHRGTRLQRSLAGLIARLSKRGRADAGPTRHFVRDYRALAAALKARNSHSRAMELGVGGEFAAYGKIERAYLLHFGLKPGDMLVDVGCGSGRLASALAEIPGIRYHGIDVVQDFLDHARSLCPPDFRFTLVDGLTIPERDAVADMVAFFSVATHLHLHETYIYLEEATRVLKPGGRIVLSFLELQNPRHWRTFRDTVSDERNGTYDHHNAFFETPVIPVWASHLGLIVEAIVHGGTPQVATDETIVFENGKRMEHTVDLGQSVGVLRKP